MMDTIATENMTSTEEAQCRDLVCTPVGNGRSDCMPAIAMRSGIKPHDNSFTLKINSYFSYLINRLNFGCIAIT